MTTRIENIPVYLFDEVESTNDTIKTLPAPCFCLASRQTKGRGRNGRSFLSGEGGIYMSYSFAPRLPVEKTGLYSIAAGIAVSRTIKGRIKWPNDVYLGNKKITGILSERKILPDGERVIIGIGINVNNDTGELPNAVSMKQVRGRSSDLKSLFVRICKSLLKIISVLEAGSDITGMYNKYAILINREAVVKTEKGEYSAYCLGIDSNGLLLVRGKDGSITKVCAGDVSIKL